jgi:tetratricopeptide (TPR) repeat protein
MSNAVAVLAYSAVSFVLIASAGCVTTPKPIEPDRPSTLSGVHLPAGRPSRTEQTGAALSPDERRFAEALSHYTMGVVCEVENGPRSPASLDHFVAAAKQDPSARRLHYRAALAHMRRGELDQAVAQLEASCKASPDSFEAWAELATICQLTDRIPAAVSAYEKAIAVSPERAFPYAKLADLHLQRSQDEKAFDVMKRGFHKTQDPDPIVTVCRDHGGIRAGTNNIAGALACFEFLAENAPSKQAESHYMAGLLYDSQKKTDKAAASYTAATRGTNAVPDAFVRLALLDADSKPRQAIDILEEGRKRFPNTPEILFLLGTLYDRVGQEEKAANAFAGASKFDPSVADSFVRLALIQFKNNPKKAQETLETASRRLPDQPVILYTLAQFHLTEKRFADAADLFSRVAALLKASGQTNLGENLYLSYGSACERAGRTNDAERVFEECVIVHPQFAEALNYLAYMWAERGENLDKALDYVQRALRREPENGAYVDTLGWILFRQKKFQQALDQLEIANLLHGDDPTVLDHIGDTHKALGNTDKAVAFWKRSFVLDPSNESVAGKLRNEKVDVEALRKEAETTKSPDKTK